MGKLVCPCNTLASTGKLALAHATRKTGCDGALASITTCEGSVKRVDGKRFRAVIRWLLLRGLTLVLALVPVISGGLWLAFHYRPSWYRPAALDDAGLQRARNHAVATADFVSDRMVEGRPFDIVLHDRSVNEWLTVLPTVWPEVKEVLPSEMAGPAVHFGPGRILIGSHYTTTRWQAILSVGLAMSLSEDGATLNLVLSGVRGGSLPVPRTIVTGTLEPLLKKAHRKGATESRAAGSLLAALRSVHSVEELFEGIEIDNRFIWFNGRRPFRIDSIRIGGGELRLRIEPL